MLCVSINIICAVAVNWQWLIHWSVLTNLFFLNWNNLLKLLLRKIDTIFGRSQCLHVHCTHKMQLNLEMAVISLFWFEFVLRGGCTGIVTVLQACISKICKVNTLKAHSHIRPHGHKPEWTWQLLQEQFTFYITVLCLFPHLSIEMGYF